MSPLGHTLRGETRSRSLVEGCPLAARLLVSKPDQRTLGTVSAHRLRYAASGAGKIRAEPDPARVWVGTTL